MSFGELERACPACAQFCAKFFDGCDLALQLGSARHEPIRTGKMRITAAQRGQAQLFACRERGNILFMRILAVNSFDCA